MSVVKLQNVEKTYILKNEYIPVLKRVNAEFECGKLYAIMGHSGAGKTTLINIIDGIESFNSGHIIINGKDISNMTKFEKALVRNNDIGMIFQDFLLDDYLTAYENVMLPMTINKKFKKRAKERAWELLKEVNLSNRVNHFPKELSGGEKQRVSIARALANDPKILICDEPTGNLDEKNENKIFEILKNLSQMGKCVIIVSHSNEVLKYADIAYELKEGKLIEK